MRGNRRLKHESHDSFRAFMRIVGPILIVIGGWMFVTGIISFNKKFDEPLTSPLERMAGIERQSEPDKFWMCFVGMPIAIVGIFFTKVGFLGAAARYVAGEVAPVASDTINYVVGETKESIRDVADAIRGEKSQDDDVFCPECSHANAADAKFCDECGNALALKCPECGEPNDADAKFCNACGTGL